MSMTTTTDTTARGNGSSSAALDIAYVAVFAALIAVLGFVAVPVGGAGVPIVLQNTGTILAGLVLGGRRGFLAAGLFLLVSLILPVLSGGHTLIQVFAGPTIGYLLGYLLGAGAAGLIAYRSPWAKHAATAGMFVLGGLVALALQYFFGSLGLVWRTDMNFGTALLSQGAFIVPDLIELTGVVAIALAVHAAFPQLRRS